MKHYTVWRFFFFSSPSFSFHCALCQCNGNILSKNKNWTRWFKFCLKNASKWLLFCYKKKNSQPENVHSNSRNKWKICMTWTWFVFIHTRLVDNIFQSNFHQTNLFGGLNVTKNAITLADSSANVHMHLFVAVRARANLSMFDRRKNVFTNNKNAGKVNIIIAIGIHIWTIKKKITIRCLNDQHRIAVLVSMSFCFIFLSCFLFHNFGENV